MRVMNDEYDEKDRAGDRRKRRTPRWTFCGRTTGSPTKLATLPYVRTRST
jgi:hypothetical protein